MKARVKIILQAAISILVPSIIIVAIAIFSVKMITEANTREIAVLVTILLMTGYASAILSIRSLIQLIKKMLKEIEEIEEDEKEVE